ncbi:MAG: hypothetical protein O2983_16365 [Planctomycetota bacterium]|nr:hypothetical protein [Planctomycetota bacterium]
MQDSQPSSELQEWHVGKRLTSPPVNEGGGGWWLVAGGWNLTLLQRRLRTRRITRQNVPTRNTP